MARVLYVSQYFVSGDQPGGVRHWQHCRALARAGHEVTVVTSYVQHKERTIPEEYRGRRIVRSTEDGLDVVRRLATQAAALLKPGGRLLIEVGYDQGESAPAALRAIGGFDDVRVERDYGGRDRVVLATRSA